MKEIKKALKDVERDLEQGRWYLDKDDLFNNLKNNILELVKEYKEKVEQEAGEWGGN